MFSNLVKKARGHVNTFFSSTLPSWKKTAHEGVRFLNGTVLPTARHVHGRVKQLNDDIQADSTIAHKTKKHFQDVSRFADLGLEKVNQTSNIASKVSKALD